MSQQVGSGIAMNIQSAGASAALGYINGMAAAIETDIYINSVLDYSWGLLSVEFDAHLDALAKQDKKSFMHVYEWGSVYSPVEEDNNIGDPAKRLWRQMLIGRGRNKIATFEFLESNEPVPVNPILLTPGPSGRAVKADIHIFHMKATAMEYGEIITVEPKLAQYLAFVTRENNGGQDENPSGNNGRGVSFSKGPVMFEAGNGKTRGKFTEAFIDFWNGYAPALFQSHIMPVLEEDTASIAAQSAVVTNRYRTKSFTIAAGAEEGARAFADAQQYAMTVTLRKQNDYLAKARERREATYGV